VTKTLESAPKNATHWSTRSMAKEVGMTPDAVMRIWHAFGLQPHRQETWKLSKDPLFIEKVHDICGLYLNPPERAVVLWVDENPTIDTLARLAQTLDIEFAIDVHPHQRQPKLLSTRARGKNTIASYRTDTAAVLLAAG
jgi:transcriptional regulator with XRE-family HTH domain